MPAPRAPPRAAQFARLLGIVVLAGIIAFCVLLLALRHVVLPRIDSQRGEIAAYLSRQVGGQVEIGALAGDWDGWNPKLLVSGLRVLDRQGDAAQALLELPKVELVVAWTSVPLLQLRLKELSIDRPRLAIRRDVAGRFHIGGLEIDPEAPLDDRAFTDWLLRQRKIEINDALITWTDERRNAPQLVLDRVQFRLVNSLGHHRFGITGVPPPELASPLDLRGDLTGSMLGDWQQATGEIYVRLDYADVAAWREWIPLPIPVDRGKGAMRMWFRFAGGVAQDVTSDVELADVRLRFESNLPPLELKHLAGRVGWKRQGERRELATHGLSFVARDGTALKPTDLTLALAEGPDGAITGGTLAFDRLEIAPLSAMARHLPLPAAWRSELARYLPRGTLTAGKFAWEGPVEAPVKYTAQSEFADFAFLAQGALPGASGLGGNFSATEREGRIKLGSRALSLSMPTWYAEPLALSRLDAALRWERQSEGYHLRVDDLAFANADFGGSLSGSWTAQAGGPGQVDLKGQVARVDVAAIGRYLPLTLDRSVREWLRSGLRQGTLSDVRLAVAGNLAEFPFGKGRRGSFQASFKGEGVTLGYADHWPVLAALDGEVKFDGPRVSVDATRGRILDAELARIKGEIPDFTASSPVYRMSAEARGPSSTFLQFIDESPIAGWIANAQKGARVVGDGHLDFRFELPLGKDEGAKVAGEYGFAGNQLHMPGLPALTQLTGKLAFTERDVTARDVDFEVMGGAAKLSVTGGVDGVQANASGTANLALLRNVYPSLFTDRISGTSEWKATMVVRPDASTWSLESPLTGAVIDLPSPLGKAAAATLPLHIDRRDSGGRGEADTLLVELAGAAKLVLQRKLGPQGANVERAQLLLGRASARAGDVDRPGLWVRGDIGMLNIDDWLAVRDRQQGKGTAGGDPGLALNGIDLEAGSLQALGRRFRDLKVVARHAGEVWRLTLAGREVEGTAAWFAPDREHPNGRIVARLKRFAVPGTGEPAPAGGPAAGEAVAQSANAWPSLDIEADRFESKGRDLGRLEVMAQPSGTDWRIDRLALTSDAGTITADGVWRAAGRLQQTKLDTKLEAQDAGALLARFGFPDAVRGAPTRIEGQLAWTGGPGEFDYPTLNGTFRVQAGAGQFTKIDPGVGKLLGVLSLQALPRRVSLDFRDVFSEGFAFDEITGNVRITNGLMRTDGLRIAGPAARVDIVGEADLAKETQELNVRVLPSLATSFSAGTAGAAMLLLAANPVVAAAIGAGALLAQKLMSDPIEQLFSYDYTVTGSWTDPVVTRLAARPTATATDPAEATAK